MKKLKAVIVGAGHRALVYASYSNDHPDELEIVGVADPSKLRRAHVAALYRLPEEKCFETAEELTKIEKFADVAINGTMDQQHVDTSLPLLKAGYDILLEKPFATSLDEMWQLRNTAAKHGRKVVICHVLRFTPYYSAIRKLVMDGVIGDIISVQTVEHVSYHHMAVGFINGKWNKKAVCGSSMLMAKCCHDMDLIAWIKSGIAPVSVASFGSNMQFQKKNAPEGAGNRCLVDCKVEADCDYSARKLYLNHPDRWSFYVWNSLEHLDNPTIEDMERSLAESDFGRCVWKSDMDVVDHQTVAVQFADGSTATHNMVGGSSKPARAVHLVGTKGEISGDFESNRFVVRHMDPSPGNEYSEEVVDITDPKEAGDKHGAFGSHGGGDGRLIADFLSVVRGETPSLSTTMIQDSISGHLMGFCADQAMEEGRVIQISMP